MKVLAQVGFFLRLDDYRAGYRGSKKGRSVYLFPGLPRRVLLGNWASGFRGSTALVVIVESVEEHVCLVLPWLSLLL